MHQDPVLPTHQAASIPPTPVIAHRIREETSVTIKSSRRDGRLSRYTCAHIAWLLSASSTAKTRRLSIRCGTSHTRRCTRRSYVREMFEPQMGRLVPECKTSVRTRCAERTVERVEADGVDRVDVSAGHLGVAAEETSLAGARAGTGAGRRVKPVTPEAEILAKRG